MLLVSPILRELYFDGIVIFGKIVFPHYNFFKSLEYSGPGHRQRDFLLFCLLKLVPCKFLSEGSGLNENFGIVWLRWEHQK